MKKISMWILLMSFSVPHHSSAQSIEPGLWKGQTHFTVNGISLPSSDQEDCIAAEEAKDVKASIVKDLKKNGCLLTQWKAKNGKLEASLVCQSEDLDASGTLKGHFTKKNYELSGEAEGTYKKMLPATAVMKLTGDWVKACQ